MNTTPKETTPAAFAPAGWLEADGWTYQADGPFTRIHDEDGELVTTFYVNLNREEVLRFKEGFELGKRRGIENGKIQKAYELRQVLGL